MNEQTAIFAGGCFWCMEPPYAQLSGVISVFPGYTGGNVPNPTYEAVCAGQTGHFEAVRITFDVDVLPYEKLLDVFWRQIDPADPGGQFVDRGSQYMTAVFYMDEAQKAAAQKSKDEIAALIGQEVATQILPAAPFYMAEGVHCKYYQTNAEHFNAYKQGSGRAAFIKEFWSKVDEKRALKDKLSPLQFAVTQQSATEPPFKNDYWDETRDGIYVDITTGKPLFSSRDKYDAGCGWPSFTRPIDEALLQTKEDLSLGRVRTEVRTSGSDIHLGHVFDDGPQPAGTRFCINSAALRFVPAEDMEQEGYGEYMKLFAGE